MTEPLKKVSKLRGASFCFLEFKIAQLNEFAKSEMKIIMEITGTYSKSFKGKWNEHFNK
jgi:hypothetical protein